MESLNASEQWAARPPLRIPDSEETTTLPALGDSGFSQSSEHCALDVFSGFRLNDLTPANLKRNTNCLRVTGDQFKGFCLKVFYHLLSQVCMCFIGQKTPPLVKVPVGKWQVMFGRKIPVEIDDVVTIKQIGHRPLTFSRFSIHTAGLIGRGSISLNGRVSRRRLVEMVSIKRFAQCCFVVCVFRLVDNEILIFSRFSIHTAGLIGRGSISLNGRVSRRRLVEMVSIKRFAQCCFVVCVFRLVDNEIPGHPLDANGGFFPGMTKQPATPIDFRGRCDQRRFLNTREHLGVLGISNL